jgi:DNA-binding IclR family transcriptional regulator
MSDADKYISDAQQRILRLVVTLAGHEIEGLAPGDIAKLQQCSASQVTRDLANLKHFGWAEQIQATGRWRLGPDIVRVATRHMTALDRADRKLAEIRSRFGSAELAGADASPRMTTQQAGQFLTDLIAPGATTRNHQS